MNSEIRNSAGEKLDYSFHGDAGKKDLLIIIGHGVTGNKDRPWCTALSSALAENEFSALAFSFSGNGDSEGEFKASTISKEVKDLGSIIDAGKAEGYEKICYIGHSMGGAVGVLRASDDDRINMMISLAGMVFTAKFCATEFGDQKPDEGFMWDEKECPLSQKFVDDMNSIGDVLDDGAKVNIPWLFVHGDDDDIVPIDESRDIYQEANRPKKMVELEYSDHVFSGESQDEMISAVLKWLKKQVS